MPAGDGETVVEVAARAAYDAWDLTFTAAYPHMDRLGPWDEINEVSQASWLAAVRAAVDVLAASDCCPLPRRLDCPADTETPGAGG